MYYRLLAGEKLEASKKPVDSTFVNWSQLELLSLNIYWAHKLRIHFVVVFH